MEKALKILENYKSQSIQKIKNITDEINNNNHFVINNGKKFYMCISKSKFNNKGTSISFLPDSLSEKEFNLSQFSTEINIKSIDNNKIGNIYEGYMYSCNLGIPDVGALEPSHFLITDLVYTNSQGYAPEKLQYYERREIITSSNFIDFISHFNDIVIPIKLGIHKTFDATQSVKKLLNIFILNFKFKNELKYVDIIQDATTLTSEKINKQCNLDTELAPVEPQEMKIVKNKGLSDIYSVYDNKTGKSLGYLYIKTLEASQTIRELFKNKDVIFKNCIFNKKFDKYELLQN